MKRAFSNLEIKSVDKESRTIKGIATTVSPDRMEDVVEPSGAQFKVPIPLLWQHKHDQPIGHVTEARTVEGKIEITAQLAEVKEPGVLRNRLDEAWQSIKSGLVGGLSIGFRALDAEPIKNSSGIRFKSWEWLELSAVTIPANMDASIQTIKSMHTSGHKSVRVNGGYKLPKPESKCYANTDGSFNLRMPGDG